MGKESRDWYRGSHPAACTCANCVSARLSSGHGSKAQQGKAPKKLLQKSKKTKKKDEIEKKVIGDKKDAKQISQSKAKSAIPEMKITISEGERRLPVYLLLDISGSMAGAPIESVRRGVEQFKQEVGEDTFTKETVYVGIITFGGEAKYVTRGLIPFDEFEPPVLSAGGETPLGQALWLLIESLDKDVRSGVKGGEKGDWKPLVFILTDGQPTDEWREPHEEIRKREVKKVINIITVGCGPYINQQNLKEIAIGPTFNMSNDDRAFKAFFRWVTQTVIAASRAISQPGGGEQITSLPPPDDIQFIPY